MGLLHSDCAHWSRQQIVSCCRYHFIGSAIQLFKSLALHLQLHLRILCEDLRIGLAKHLRYPLVGYSSGTQPCGVCGAKIVRAIGANLAESDSLRAVETRNQVATSLLTTGLPENLKGYCRTPVENL